MRLPGLRAFVVDGLLHRKPVLLQLRQLPVDLLRELELPVLPGLQRRLHLVHGDAVLLHLRELPDHILRELELPAVLPGLHALGRLVHRHAVLQHVRLVRDGVRELQQHLLRRVHRGHG